MDKWYTRSLKTFGSRTLVVLTAGLMLALGPEPVPAQLGLADLKLREMEDRRAAQNEIASRMQAIIVILADEFGRTRDQAMVEHHRANTDIHSHFGTLATAATEAGLKVHLCAANSSEFIRRDWLIVWYDPTEALRNIATPEEVRLATSRVDGARIHTGDHQLFRIEENDPWFVMSGGRPVPDGLVDCHAALDANTVGLAIQPRIKVIERNRDYDWDSEFRHCPAPRVGGIRWRREITTITTGHDERPQVGYYSAPEGPPPATETSPGSGVFDTGWFQADDFCRDPDSGTRNQAETCTWEDDGGTVRPGVRIVEVGWTEVADPDDPRGTNINETGIIREIVPCGDWGTDQLQNDLDVPIHQREDVGQQRAIACGSVHNGRYPRGTRIENRVRTTVTTSWPNRMNREDDVVEAHTPWRVDPASCLSVRQGDGTLANLDNVVPTCHDACHRISSIAETERQTQSCPAGFVGTRVRVRTRQVDVMEYAEPVPHLDDETIATGDWGPWSWESSNCRQSGGGSDDDDDNGGFTPSNNNDDDTVPDTEMCLTGRCRNNLDDNGSYTTIPADDTNDGHGNNQNKGNQNKGNQKKCFLTTAVVERLGEADDGPTLTLLRTFRDGWLMSQTDGEQLISRYYRIAPLLVERIPPNHDEWDRIASEVEAAANAIRTGNPEGANDIYRSMVERLAKTWLNQ